MKTLATFLAALALAVSVPAVGQHLTFSTDFPGASIGEIEKIDGEIEGETVTTYRIAMPRQCDERRLNTQSTWFAFRVEVTGEKPWRLVFHDFDSVYNGRPARPDWSGQRPVFRPADSDTWQVLPEECVTWDPAARTLTIHDFRPASDVFYLAYTEMYTAENLEKLLDAVRTHERVKVETVGKSLEGRDIRRLTITDFSVPDTDKKHFYIMARQHAWEAHTSWQVDGLAAFLTHDDGLELCQKAVFHIVPIVDPDGVENGQIRFNGKGYDVNRRWNEVDVSREDAPTRALRPEVWYVKRDILRLNAEHPLAVVVNLHGDTRTDYIDAAGDPERDWPKFRAFDAAFSATEHYDPFAHHPLTLIKREEDKVPTTFDLWWSHGIPTLMIEQKVVANRKTAKFPTWRDSQKRGRVMGEILVETFSTAH